MNVVEYVAEAMIKYDRETEGPKTWRELAEVAIKAEREFASKQVWAELPG